MNYLIKNKVYLLLFLILLVGTWLRVDGILQNSFAFTYDVGRDLIAARNIVVNHDIMLIGPTTGLEGVFYGPWYYYILVVPFLLGNGNPQVIALFIALTGILAIAMGYLFGKRIGGEYLGISFAGLLALAHATVGLSIQIWSPNLIPILLLISLLLVDQILRKDIRHMTYHLFALGFTLGLIIDMEIIFGLLFLPAVSILVIISKKKNIYNWRIASFFAGLFLTFLSRVIFELRHDFLMTKSLTKLTEALSPENETINLGVRMVMQMKQLFELYASTIVPNSIQVGYIVAILSILVVLILYRKMSKYEKTWVLFSAIIFVVFLLGSTLLQRAIWSHYLTGLPVVYLLFFSLAGYAMWKYMKFPKTLTLGIVFLVTISSSNPFAILESFGKPLWEGNAAVYRNQVAVIDYVYSEAKGKPFKYIVYTPAVHDYPYRYLFTWYGKDRYGYIPEETKAPQFFVIIEPDPGYEWRQKAWIKSRENDGKVIKQEVVKGGIIVQTRVQ